MKFEIATYTRQSFSMVNIEHPGEDILVYETSGYSSTVPGASSDMPNNGGKKVQLFDEVNDFIQTKITKEKQLELYILYDRINNLFSDSIVSRRKGGATGEMFDRTLSDLVRRIYNIVKFNDLRDYITTLFKARKIDIPSDIADSYQTEDKLTPRYVDCTYLTEDYLDLVTMCLGVRFMIPIWGRYMPLKKYDDKSAMKEYHSFQLLMGSSFYKAPCFSRLDVYVRGGLEDRNDLGVVLSNLSAEEIPLFLMSITIVRKLSVASLTSEDGKHHLIRMMYHYIDSKSKNLGTTLGNAVEAKRRGRSEYDGEDNSSVWDKYKMREMIPAGDLAVTEVFLNNHTGDNPDKTQLCHSYITDGIKFNPRECQIALATWVIGTEIPGNAVPLFDRAVLKRVFAIVQSQLWEWGFNELAILLTAMPVPLDPGEVLGSIGRRMLTDDRIEKLKQVYPYLLIVNNHDPFGHEENVGIRSVERMAAMFYEHEWSVSCPIELAQTVSGLDKINIFEAPNNLRNTLADLLIKLDTRH